MTKIALPPLLRARRVRLALIVTAVGLCLGLAAPFGSYLNPGFGWRLLYWCGSVWVGLMLLLGGEQAWQRFGAELGRGRWAMLAAWLAAATLLQATMTRLAALAIWPELHRDGPGWGVWCLQSGLIEAVGFMTLLVVRRRAASKGAMAPDEAACVERPARTTNLGKDVIALQMEDHYVRVHTAAGSRLVHMTLGEAIETLGPADGLKTHRSWWVARDAVERIEGTPRAMRLHLRGGITAPVARGAVTLLREAGWIGFAVAIGE